MVAGFLIGFGLGATLVGFTLIRKYEEVVKVLNKKADVYQETANNYIEDNFELMNEIIRLKSEKSDN